VPSLPTSKQQYAGAAKRDFVKEPMITSSSHEEEFFSEMIFRSQLLERLRTEPYRLLLLCAPAGYGKSTLARAQANQWSRQAVCDCRDIKGMIAAADGILNALAQENPERTIAYAHEKLGLGSNAEQWMLYTLAEWKREAPASIFLFENVERIAEDRDAEHLIGKLLSAPHPSRRLIICSRTPPPLRTSAFAPPNETTVLGPDELRFDNAEIRQIFRRLDVNEANLSRVEKLTRGWPISVLSLARLARRGRLEAAIDAARDVSFDHVHEYLMEEVFRYLNGDQRDILIAASAIPRATERDIIYALTSEHDRTIDPQLIATTPFLSCDEKMIAPHALIRQFVDRHHSQRARRFAEYAAERNLSDDNSIRAAQIFLSIGKAEQGASALAPLAYWFANSPPEMIELIATCERIDRATFLAHPALWCTVVFWRLQTMRHVEFLHEARIVWEQHFAGSPLSIRLGIASGLICCALILGHFSEAAEAIDAFERSLTPEETPLGEQHAFGWRCTLRAFEGLPFDVQAATQRMAPLVLYAPQSASLWYYSVVARTHLLQGERDAQRAILNKALDCAIASKTGLGVGIILIEATFGAWFWGEEELFQAYLLQLEAQHHVPSFERKSRFFINCARGHAADAKRDLEKPRILVFALLIASATSLHRSRARRFAFEALTAADESGQRFLKVVTRVALALIDPTRAPELLAGAECLAQETESPKLIDAVIALRRGTSQLGMLKHFAARFRNAQPTNALRPFSVSLASRRVTHEDRNISLSKRELELIVFLACRRRAVSSQEIADALWQDASISADAVYAAVSRLRARLPKDTLIRSAEGYALAPHVDIDLIRIENRLRAINRRPPFSEEQRSELTAMCEQLSAPAADDLAPWPWFDEVQARIDRFRNEIVALLAHNAFANKAYIEALTLARTQLLRDECDETACEIAIQAALALGDRSGASHILGAYERSLKREIGAQAPPYLRRLLYAETVSSSTPHASTRTLSASS